MRKQDPLSPLSERGLDESGKKIALAQKLADHELVDREYPALVRLWAEAVELLGAASTMDLTCASITAIEQLNKSLGERFGSLTFTGSYPDGAKNKATITELFWERLQSVVNFKTASITLQEETETIVGNSIFTIFKNFLVSYSSIVSQEAMELLTQETNKIQTVRNELGLGLGSIVVVLPEAQFGYFYSVASMCGKNVFPIHTRCNKEYKVDLEALRNVLQKLKGREEPAYSSHANEDRGLSSAFEPKIVFVLINPSNPTQAVYTQEEINEIAELLIEYEVDYIFEDLTFALTRKNEIKNKVLQAGILDGRFRFEYEDALDYLSHYGRKTDTEQTSDLLSSTKLLEPSKETILRGRSLEEQAALGTFSRTRMPKVLERLGTFFSPSKAFTAGARISVMLSSSKSLKEILSPAQNEQFNTPTTSVNQLEFFMSGAKGVFLPHIFTETYLRCHKKYQNLLFVVNIRIVKELRKNAPETNACSEFVSLYPKNYMGTNVANIDFSGCSELKFTFKGSGRDFVIKNGIDAFQFILTATRAKTFAAETSFVRSAQVRVPLGIGKGQFKAFADSLLRFIKECKITAIKAQERKGLKQHALSAVPLSEGRPKCDSCYSPKEGLLKGEQDLGPLIDHLIHKKHGRRAEQVSR